MPRIDPPQKFVFVEAEADGVIGLPGTGFPFGFLAGKDNGKPVKIGDRLSIHRRSKYYGRTDARVWTISE